MEKLFSKWNIMFLFAVGVVMGDLRMVELGDNVMLFDSLTIQTMGYAAGVLVFAFLPGARILGAGRIGAVMAIAALVAGDLAPQPALLELYTVYSLANGLCIGCALYVFFSILNNKERFFNLIVIQLYFAVFVYGPAGSSGLRVFLSDVFVYIIAAFFLLSLLMIRKGGVPKKPAPLSRVCGTADACCRVGKSSMPAIFYVYVIFFVVDSINIFIIHKNDYIDYGAYSAGTLASIAVAVLIQLLLGKSGLYTWKIFLVGSIVSMVLLAMNGVFDIKAGSMLFGLAHSLGYISIFYFLGGAAYLTGCLKFFRLFCVIMFILSFALNPAIEYLFVELNEDNNLIALGLMVAVVCLTFLLYPTLYRKIFESDWIVDVRIFKPDILKPDILKSLKDAEHADEAPAPDFTDGLGLTPREKQIFKLMLTDMSVKQIMIELEISKGTLNFHSANLYRKLDIQSRTELFAKYGRA